MSSVRKKATALVPANVKSRLRSAVHPAQRYALARTVGKRPANLGTLSVVIPLYNVEGYLAACLDSVISQSYLHLDIIVVDDGSTDTSLFIAQQYARWDKRIRIISLEHGGNGRARNVAIDAARGDFLTFADSDDVVAGNAYQIMMEKIAASGSDFVVGSSDRLIGKKKVPTKQATRLHASERTATSLQDFPEVLDDVFLWNKIFRKAFWDNSVAPIPEGVLYEDQETTARAYLRANAFDVLVENVYSWRQRPGAASITQGKREMRNLQDRLLVAAHVSDLVLREGTAETARVWYLRLFGSDLVPYFDLVANRGESYWEALSTAVRLIDHKFQESGVIAAQTVERMDPHARVFLGLARLGLREEVEKVIVDRINIGTGYEVEYKNGRFFAIPNYWHELLQITPIEPLVCTPDLLNFEADIRLRDHQDGRGQFLEGYAYVRGFDVQKTSWKTVCTFNFIDGSSKAAQVEPRSNGELDVSAGDPFAAHAASGFHVAMEPGGEYLQVKSVQIDLELDGIRFSTLKQVPKKPALEAHLKFPLVVAFATFGAEGTFQVTVDWGSSAQPEGVFLSTKRTVIRPTVSNPLDNTQMQYTFRLRHSSWGQEVLSYPSGAYTLRFLQAKDTLPTSIAVASEVVLAAPLHRELKHANITAWVTEGGKFAVTIAAPLSQSERTKFHQRLIQRKFHSERQIDNHVVIESFSGTVCTDSPKALAENLHQLQPDVPIYCSVDDYSVLIPEYAIALVRNTEKWVEKVSTAKLLINNNNFPFYFRKDSLQTYLQTWHGTPMKKIGADTPVTYTSPSYRNALENESKSWTAMVAQNEYSSKIFTNCFSFRGDTIVEGYPRNDALFKDREKRETIRNALGIQENETVVLVAPTWRDDEYKSGAGAGNDRLDIEKLAALIGGKFKFLLRAHHNEGGLVGSDPHESIVNVTTYPEINDLIIASDCLVSDYSSIVFDYSTTGKPIFGYIPDMGRYESMRGTYINASEVFGQSTSNSISLLAESILNFETVPEKAIGSWYLKEKYAPLDDGNASKRVLKAVFNIMQST